MNLENKPICIRPQIFEQFSCVVAAQSTRHGGVSPVPFDSLNLGISTADNPEYIQQNRGRFFEKLGIDSSEIVSSFQIHSDKILVAENVGYHTGYDAIITDIPNIFTAVSVADCVPILIYDPKNNAVAAIHAGWRGTVAGIVQQTMVRMQAEYNTRSSNCFVYIGACIGEETFEVGKDVAQHFSKNFVRKSPIHIQKYFVDLKQANASQLIQANVPISQIEISPYDTVLDNQHFFSHRHEKGTTGRMMAVIGFLKQ